MNFEQQKRYARNIALKEIDKTGQQKLLKSKVLVIGAGGLGCPNLLYLAANGVGEIGIVDFDKVDLSNLQRQILFETRDIGQSKVESAKDALLDINPEIKINIYDVPLDEKNASNIIKKYDIVADGSDNVQTRYLVNKVCFEEKKPLVSAAIKGFLGQLSVFKPYLNNDYPCYQCLYPDLMKEDTDVNSCNDYGVLGSVAGVLGTLQATETIKEILGIGELKPEFLILFDGLKAEMRKVQVNKNPHCAICA